MRFCYFLYKLNVINVMFGANIKPRPLGEVAAYAAGEGKENKFN